MTLNEIIDIQKKFDGNHGGAFSWDSRITEDNLEILEFLMISLMGEVGETANLIKKIIRGDFSLDEKRNEIANEIVDVFIYLIKISYQLDIDLEVSYKEKMEKNKERFERYEKADFKKAKS